MKKRRILALLLVLAMFSAFLTGCGAASNSGRSAAYEEMAADAAPMEAGTPAAGALNADQGSSSTALPESRKWIVTVYISAETEDLDAATAALQAEIEALEGYVEDQSIHNGSAYSDRRYRSASMTVRVPAEQVDSFTEALSGIANVVSRDKSLEDVTLSYVATENRVKALETEEARLLELLAQAETMADLLEIEARLTDVRYELESVASQLRLYDNQIDYATVYLDIEEVLEFTPVEEPSVGQRIQDGFVRSLKGLGNGLVNLAVWVLAYSPYLLVLGALTTGVVLLIKRRRKNKKPKDKPQA